MLILLKLSKVVWKPEQNNFVKIQNAIKVQTFMQNMVYTPSFEKMELFTQMQTRDFLMYNRGRAGFL